MKTKVDKMTRKAWSLARRLGGRLETVKIQPVEGAVKNHCFQNAADYAVAHGGELVIGWQIVGFDHNVGLLFAYHHGVVRSPYGDLYDITPSEFTEGSQDGKVYGFVADPSSTLLHVNGWRIARPSKVLPIHKRYMDRARHFEQHQIDHDRAMFEEVMSKPPTEADLGNIPPDVVGDVATWDEFIGEDEIVVL
jgi:hypothetical protein